MGPKKNRSNPTGQEEIKVVRTTMELKKYIIAKFENGVRVSDLAAQYNMARSTISTFMKNKEAIKAADVANGVTIVHSKQAVHIFKDKAMMHLRKILQHRQKQLTFYKFVAKKARKTTVEKKESTASKRQRRGKRQNENCTVFL